MATQRTATLDPHLVPVVAVEVGEGQAAAVAELARAAGFGSVDMRRDLAGIERAVIASAAAGAG